MKEYLKVENGKVEDKKSENHWTCINREDGCIICIAEKEYSDGVHKLVYEINPNGYYSRKLYLPGKRERKTGGFMTRKDESIEDGLLALSVGFIDSRLVSFYTRKFLDSLK